MKERIKSCISNLKHLPGVYLMHDKDDKIIYIGKAKDLYKRVSQYFLRPQSGKVFKMVTSEFLMFSTVLGDLFSSEVMNSISSEGINLTRFCATLPKPIKPIIIFFTLHFKQHHVMKVSANVS